VRIKAAELFSIRIPFKGSFKHALKERNTAEAILVSLTGESGEVGWGEIVPRPYLTGETLQSVWNEAPVLAGHLSTLSFGSADHLAATLLAELDAAGRKLALWSGFELALLDLYGKEHNLQVGSLFTDTLGPELPPGAVIGLEVATAQLPRHCAMLRMSGKKHLKVKVGAPDDFVRLTAIARAFPGIPLRLDANSTWSRGQAAAELDKFSVFPISSVEQPLPANDYEGLRQLRQLTGIPIMADESLCTADDAWRLIDEEAADIFNIRLGKCGGFFGSRRLAEIARGAGIGCHLGALVGETGILSSAAEIFGRIVPGFECLEGKKQNQLLLESDIVDSVPTGPGLGIRADDRKIDNYLVARSSIF
jgi:muconate cycloisomerase